VAFPTESSEAMAPAATRGQAQPQVRDWALWLGGLIAAMIVGSRLLSLAADPSPWIDEAMIGLNLRLIRWDGILHPLPLFDQTAPLGFVLVGKAVSDLAAQHFILAMRALAAVASLAAAGLYFLGLKTARPTAEAALMVGLLMLSPALVYHGVEIKHYMFEVLGTVLVMAGGLNALRAGADLKSMILFAIASAAALLISFPAGLVIAGFGGALFVFLALEPERSLRKLATVAVVGVVLIALQAWIYLGYSQPAVALQLQAYSGKYAVAHLAFPPLSLADLAGWSRILRQLIKPYVGWPSALLLVGFAGIGSIGWVRGLFSPSRPTRYLFVAASIAIGGMFAAACLGLFTPKADRHILFLAPLTAPALVLGLSTILTWAASLTAKPSRAPAASAALVALILLYGARGLVLSANAEREPMRPMLERAKAEGGWPGQTWVYFAGQPAVELLSYPQTPAYLGRIEHASSAQTWSHSAVTVDGANGPYIARFARETANLPRVYILFSHTKVKVISLLVATAERTVGPCRLLDKAGGNQGVAGLYVCIRPTAPPA
jgi:hypothetical protein